MLIAQRRKLRPLGAQLRLQAAAQLAGLVEVGLALRYPFLVAPLVALAGAAELGDLLAGREVPAAHDDGAHDGGRGGRRGEAAEHDRFREEPGAAGCRRERGLRPSREEAAGARVGNGGGVHVAWPETYRA